MKVDEIMTRNVHTCSPHDTLATAAQIMWENDCGVVPLVDRDGKLVGNITDRDLAMSAHLQNVALRESRVTNAMARDVKSCSPQDSPATVQALMQQHKVRRIPVLDSERRVVGIVSLGDLAHVMSTQQTLGGDGMTWTALAHTLSAVSAPRHPRYRR